MTLQHTSYPVFEADQVLSQKHLNTLMCYLEEQDRASRVHLTGMGILCGLDISIPASNQVAISCGTGITSLGYLIPFEGATYTKFKETTISDHFLNPDLTAHPYLEEVYAFAKAYQPLTPCLELLPDGTSDQAQQPLTDALLEDKVIMLLVEVPLIDEKNCTTIDCADKGQRLELNLRPLLVDPAVLETLPDLSELNACLKRVVFKRYNVPAMTINTGQEVLNAFKRLIDSSTILHLDDRVHDLFRALSVFYGTSDIENLSQLNAIRPAIDTVKNAGEDTLSIQYIWDWLCDIGHAYNEIVDHICNNGYMGCCPVRELFPFHVLVGSTDAILDRFRTPWIGAEDGQNDSDGDILRLLITRLITIVGAYKVPSFSSPIRLTPSRYGKDPLSHRALPYYYQNIISLKKTWNPDNTVKGQENCLLSYHAQTYADGHPEITQPLLYSIEPYNFFRIEGHIGQNYQQVLTTLLNAKSVHQLPFDIIALNAVDYDRMELRLEDYEGDFGSLELDYDLVRRDWENVIGKNIEWIEAHFDQVLQTIGNRQQLNIFIRDLKRGRNAMVETLRPFLLNYYSFMDTYEAIEETGVRFRESIFSALSSSKTPQFDEDLIDHMDAIIMVCQKGEFRQLFQTARVRWKEISAAGTFRKFVETHPGLDHKAGVPKGGTFVLVYQDTRAYTTSSAFDKKTVIPPLVMATEMNASAFLPRTRYSADRDVGTRYYLGKKSPTCDESFAGNFLAYAANYLPAANYQLLENYFTDYYARPAPDQETTDVPETVILADFFLPYRCCAGDGGVHFTLPEVKTPAIVADFEGADFDGNDFYTNDQ